VLLAHWCSRVSVVTFQEHDVFYVAVCRNRPASTLLLHKLAGHASLSSSPPRADSGERK
jgi:hypothetical protein